MSENQRPSESYYNSYRSEAEAQRRLMESSEAYRKGENAYRPTKETKADKTAPLSLNVEDTKDSETYAGYRPKSKAATTSQSQIEDSEWKTISEAKRKAEKPPSSGGATAGSDDMNAGDGDPDRRAARRATTIRATAKPKASADKTKTGGEEK